MSEYKQLCVWEGVLMDGQTPESFKEYIEEEMDSRAKFEEQVYTLPEMKDGVPVKGTGGRSDIFFYIHNEDIGKFAVRRLQYGIRWWEDVLGNGNGKLYSQDVLDRYPATWNEKAIASQEE